MRIEQLQRWADFAAEAGAPAVITHCGFLPENMTDPEFEGVATAIWEVASYCKRLGIGFLFAAKLHPALGTDSQTHLVFVHAGRQRGHVHPGAHLVDGGFGFIQMPCLAGALRQVEEKLPETVVLPAWPADIVVLTG